MALLFQPLTLKGIQLRNRIVVSPMCQYSSEDGFANDWHLVHLGSRAVGGAALVFTEATAVNPEGRISPADLGIWKDVHIPNLKRITNIIESNGAVPGIQLAHAGRKASHKAPWLGGAALTAEEGAWQTVAPSPIAFKKEEPAPKALTITDIHNLIKDFVNATERAVQAGFKVLEIHGAHGYLINEFLSPNSNLRTDEYGGSFQNRIRFLLEIIDAIQKVWPAANPLFVRLSISEWSESGWTVDDSLKLASILKNKGVDLIDCSSGGNTHGVRIPTGPLYQVEFAAHIKKESGIATGAVGLITTAHEAESILANGQADLIFLARQLLRDPYFPLHAAKELGVDVNWPSQYERAKN